MKYISVIEIGNKLKIDKKTVIKRFNKLNIEPIKIGNKFYYSVDNVKDIKEYKEIRNFITPNERFSVIEYFLSNRNNSSPDLTKVFFISQARIDKIISDYLKNNNCITIPSKMNKIL